MSRLLALLLFWGFTASGGQSARILAFFPTPARSHHFFHDPIIVELGRLGHRVDYYSPFEMDEAHPNVTWTPLEDYSRTLFNSSISEPWYSFILAENEREMARWFSGAARMAELSCESHAIQELLRSTEQYDLLIHESSLNEIENVFAHKFKALSVAFSPVNDAFHLNEITGLNTNPAFMIDSLSRTTDRMNFLERLQNAYSFGTSNFLLYYSYLDRLQSVASKCYRYPGWENRPPLSQLVADQALLLGNAHPSIGFAFPRAPHFKEIGGAVIKAVKPLPKDLDDFMNEAKQGVIYFSLGTIVDIGKSNELKKVFNEVLSARNERILWKWSGKPFKNPPVNVLFSRFFPQQDVLRHPNLKLFITHAGLQSIFEAVHFAVPVILVPFMADQPKNAMGLEKLGLGVRLDKDNISVASLNWAIDEVITQPKYKERALKASEALRDRPMDPVKEATFWIEYVLKHGKVLQPASLKLSAVQFHCVDIYAAFSLVVIATFFVTKSLIGITISWLKYQRSENPKLKKY